MISELRENQLNEVSGGGLRLIQTPTLPQIDNSTRSGRRAIRAEINERRLILAFGPQAVRFSDNGGGFREVRRQIRVLRAAVRPGAPGR